MNIKTVAKAMGVSPATVSYALNGTNRVSSEMREKIIEKADELGYHPNHFARGLTKRKTNFIGFDFCLQDLFTYPQNAQLIAVLQKELRAKGYNLLLNTSGSYNNADVPITWVKSGMVDAMIFYGSPFFPELLNFSKQSKIPFIEIIAGEHPVMPNAASILIDIKAGMMAAVNHISNLGHRRIVYCENEQFSNDISTLILMDCFKSQGYTDRDIEIIRIPDTIAGGRQGLSRAMQSPIKPTLIITHGEMMTLGIMREAQHRALKVPDELSVIMGGELSSPDLTEPQLSSWLPDVNAISQTALKMLTAIFDGANPSDLVEKVATLFIDRNSVSINT